MRTLVVLVFLFVCGCVDSDDTDGPDGPSGLTLVTDHKTGCQYVGFRGLYGAGGITPRVDGHGHHVGCR